MTGIKNYTLVTAAYWGFTLTDGALRMLVLLHFHQLGYSPVQIAFLFLLYEFFGIVTNLIGGWVGSQLGLKVTLFNGLALQVLALAALLRHGPTGIVRDRQRPAKNEQQKRHSGINPSTGGRCSV